MKPEILKDFYTFTKNIPASDPDTKIIEATAVVQDPKTKNLPSLFSKLSQEFQLFVPLKNTFVDPTIRDYFFTLKSHDNLAGAKVLSSVGGAAEIAKVPIMGKWFALKSVLSDIEITRSKTHFQPRYALEQILNEAMVLDEIGYSKHIINIHHYGWFPNDNSPFSNRNFILLDFCVGGDLSAKNLRNTLFQNQSRYQHIVQVGYEMALALNALQQLGVVHRDIKPRNILWDEKKSKFVLIDFGLAVKYGKKLFGDDPNKAVIGTPAYMSPEQIKGDSIDFRSDQYALGAVLYELLSGKAPHEECHSSYEVLTSVLYNKINISEDLCKIEALRQTIQLMTQKDPEKRIQDPQELVNRFKEIQSQCR